MGSIVRLFFLPTLMGVVGGISAILMRELIKGSSFLAGSVNFFESNSYLYLVSIPAVFLVSSIIIEKVLNKATNPTIDAVARSIALKKGRLDYKKGILSVILTAVNIGFGVPVGREGPIAKLGGSLSYFTLKNLKTESVNTPLLVSCGVSSALAATFNAPIAAVVFGLEIILGRLNFNVIIPLSVSSVVGDMISRYFFGNYPAFFVPKLTYDLRLMFFVPFFAVLFAFAVYLFDVVFSSVEEIFEKLRFSSSYIKAIVGGFVVGLILWLYPDVASLGYKQISMLFEGGYLPREALTLGLVKLIALAITFASGMFGGVFAPSIFGGAFFGYAVGAVFNHFFSFIDPYAVALVGTAAVTASISSAPFRSTLIVVELAQNYHMILPLMLGSVISMYLSHIFEGKIHFIRPIMQKGFDLMDDAYKEKLKKVKVSNFIDTTVKTLTPEQKIRDVIFELMNEKSSYFAVVEKDKLVGVLSFRDIRLIGELNSSDIEVKELMTINPSFLSLSSNALDVFEFISHIDVDYIPVVDDTSSLSYLGMLDVNAFLKFASFVYFKDKIRFGGFNK
ncbi:chloride channel protein [Hippea jasoniae]|uniref:chloride channel protein n=1 Tax=Hippea jasoniae TaxID=944479 RepID=UPI000557ECBA|nr:chloride channel protein [Hippea jasoniae]